MAFSKVPSCKEFLEALAAEAVKKLANIDPPLLVVLTQTLMMLGSENDSLKKLLDFWAISLDDKDKVKLPSDQLAKLAQLVASVVPDHGGFWKSLGARLVA